jgi:hypothetical protein
MFDSLEVNPAFVVMRDIGFTHLREQGRIWECDGLPPPKKHREAPHPAKQAPKPPLPPSPNLR